MSSATSFKVVSYATRLSPLDAFAMSVILDECVDKLHTLGYVIPAPPQPEDRFKTLEERFDPDMRTRSVETAFVTELLEAAPTYTEEQENLMKLQRDRSYCERVLSEVSAELKACGTFSTLIHALRLEEEKEEEENNLVINSEYLAEEVEKLRAEVGEEGAKGEKQLKQREEMFAHRKDQLQEIRLKGSMECHYVAHWEESRCSQNALRLQMKEEELRNSVNNCRHQVDREVRVATEIDSFLNTAQRSLERQISEWSEIYAHDVDKKDEELMKLKAVRTRDFHRLQDLAVLYQEHDQALQEWLKHKEELEEERRHEELRIAAAIQIQAWWRGQMVRRGLGKFKKLFKKKGAKGKNSAKKKRGGSAKKSSRGATPTKKK